MRPEPFRSGQHVHSGGGIILKICGWRDSRHGGTYTVQRVWPRGYGVDEFAQSARTQEWLLHELTEADLCRVPRHGCGLIHVPADYRIEPGVRCDRPRGAR